MVLITASTRRRVAGGRLAQCQYLRTAFIDIDVAGIDLVVVRDYRFGGGRLAAVEGRDRHSELSLDEPPISSTRERISSSSVLNLWE